MFGPVCLWWINWPCPVYPQRLQDRAPPLRQGVRLPTLQERAELSMQCGEVRPLAAGGAVLPLWGPWRGPLGREHHRQER